MGLKDWLGRLVIRNRAPVIATVLLLSVFFSFFAVRLKVAGSSEGWVDRGDPEIRKLFEFIAKFGSHEALIVGVETEDTVFRRDVLELIARVTERAEKVPHVKKVVSLSNVRDLVSGGYGPVYERVMGEVPRTARETARLKEAVLGNPLFISNIVSADGRSAAVVAFVVSRDYGGTYVSQLDRDFRRIVRGEAVPGVRLHLAGPAILDAEINRISRHQNTVFPPAVFVLIVLLLVFIFRSAGGVLFPTAAIAASMVWTLGVFSLSGRTLGIMTTILAPLILVLGVAICVHVVTQYREEASGSADSGEAVSRAFASIARPCLFTALTTAAGFSALTLSRIPMVKELGAFATAGVFITLAVSMSVVPALLTYVRLPRGGAGGDFAGGAFDGALGWTARVNARYRWHIVVGTAAVFAAGAAGISRIVVETNELELLHAGNAVRRDTAFVENELSGMVSVEFIIEGDGTVADPATLREMRRFQSYLDRLDGVVKTVSLADYVSLIHRAFKGGGGGRRDLPESREEIERYLRLASIHGAGELAPYVTEDWRYARLSARMRLLSTRELADRLGKMREYIRGREREHFRVGVTGLVPLYVKMVDDVVWGQIRGFAFVVGAVFAMMAALMRSPLLAVMGMIPNLVPVGVTLGMMGWAGIPLDVATSTIGCIAIGIAVDDTIHYLSRHGREYRARGDHEEAMRATLRTTGRAIVTTSIVLFCGFAILLFSRFVPIFYFGMLTGFTMLTALLGDLFLLPSMLLIFKPRMGARSPGAEERRPAR
ncbi:MAG: MMPL family transporter [bacterium]